MSKTVLAFVLCVSIALLLALALFRPHRRITEVFYWIAAIIGMFAVGVFL